VKLDELDLKRLSRVGGGEGPRAAGPPHAIPLPRRRWAYRVGIPAAVLVAAGLSFLWAAGDAVLPAAEVRVVPVVVKKSATSGGAVVVQAAGWIEPDPYPTAVAALTDGVVREVLVLEGEPAARDQIVAVLVDEDARLSLAQSEAEVSARKAALRAAEAAARAAEQVWENPYELTRRVASAEAQLAERQAELAQWPSELAVEEARAAQLDAEWSRMERLHEQKQASEIEHVRIRQQWAAQRALVEVVRARKAILQAQARAAEAEVAAAREELRLRIADARALEQARAEVERAKAALALAEAVRDEARLRLERTQVRSPVDGVVMTRLVEPGSRVVMRTDDPRSSWVVRLYDPKRLQVRVDVPLADAANVAVGQPAEIVAHVLPDRTLTGRVTRVVHEADVQKNTLQVKVAIDDPPAELKPEMLARVRFLAAAPAGGESQTERVFAPESLIRRQGDGAAQAWLVDQSRNVVEVRAVRPGAVRVEGWIAVDEGLRPGDLLIADAPAGLKDGQRVRIVGEAAAAGGGSWR
jgi:HlyD family secretion protein